MAISESKNSPLVLRVEQEHHIPLARQECLALANAIGFRVDSAHRAATCVSEMASNLCQHTRRGGTITLTVVRRNSGVGIEVVSKDDGPGIFNLDEAMTDGFSTRDGLGGGLPGMRRMMDEFEIRSKMGAGTRVAAKKWNPCE